MAHLRLYSNFALSFWPWLGLAERIADHSQHWTSVLLQCCPAIVSGDLAAISRECTASCSLVPGICVPGRGSHPRLVIARGSQIQDYNLQYKWAWPGLMAECPWGGMACRRSHDERLRDQAGSRQSGRERSQPGAHRHRLLTLKSGHPAPLQCSWLPSRNGTPAACPHTCTHIDVIPVIYNMI